MARSTLRMIALLQAVLLASSQNVPFPDGDPNLLFIGNSYTFFNDMKTLVKNLLQQNVPEWNAPPGVFTAQETPGGQQFFGHLRNIDGTLGDTQIRQYLVTNPINWKWVNLQEQSQIGGYVGFPIYDSSRNSAVSINNFIANIPGAQTLFMMTWGRRDGDRFNQQIYPDFLSMQARLESGYKMYVTATTTATRQTYLAPVGLVFERIWRDVNATGIDPPTPGTLFYRLYNPDGSHPSLEGSFAAAVTIYTIMTGHDPTTGSNLCVPDGMSAQDAQTIREAVLAVVEETLTNGEIIYPFTLLSTAPTTSVTSCPTVSPSPSVSPSNVPSKAPLTDAPSYCGKYTREFLFETSCNLWYQPRRCCGYIPQTKYIFVTSTEFSADLTISTGGNLGGVEGADAICQQHASAASLEGIYKAWIATSAENAPRQRFDRSHKGNYIRRDHQVVYKCWHDLISGRIPQNSFWMDEKKNLITSSTQGAATNVDEFGRFYSNNNGNEAAVPIGNCMSFQYDDTSGGELAPSQEAVGVSEQGLGLSPDNFIQCNQKIRLICVQQ